MPAFYRPFGIYCAYHPTAPPAWRAGHCVSIRHNINYAATLTDISLFYYNFVPVI